MITTNLILDLITIGNRPISICKKKEKKKKWNFHGAGSEKSQDYYNIKKLSYI